MAREIRNDQNYAEKLLRLIPSEIVAAYLIIIGIIPTYDSKWGIFVVSIIILILIPFYLWRVQNVKNKLQITATSIAFVVWIYSLNGGPFFYWGLYRPWIASIALILWTLVMPIFIGEESIPLPAVRKSKVSILVKSKSNSKKSGKR